MKHLKKVVVTFRLLLMFSLTIIFIISCSDNSTNNVPDSENLSMRQMLALTGGSLDSLIGPNLVDSANAMLLTSIISPTVSNGELSPGPTRTKIAGYFTNISTINTCTFDITNLVKVDTYPKVFLAPAGWITDSTHFYQEQFTWSFTTTSNETVRDTFNLGKTLRPVTIQQGDSVSLAQPITITWNPQGDSGMIYIDFVWYDVNVTTSERYVGFRVTDNGSYTLSAGQLSALGIPTQGWINFDIHRALYKQKPFANGTKKMLDVTLTEASVLVWLKP